MSYLNYLVNLDSEANLLEDYFLRISMDKKGWVQISLIATFNRVSQSCLIKLESFSQDLFPCQSYHSQMDSYNLYRFVFFLIVPSSHIYLIQGYLFFLQIRSLTSEISVVMDSLKTSTILEVQVTTQIFSGYFGGNYS